MRIHLCKIVFCLLGASVTAGASQLPPNRWVELQRDPTGGRRGCAIRYVPEERTFFLWGFMNDDPELLQEYPLMEVPEYDMVYFDPADGRWRNHLPRERKALWSMRLPLAYIPRTYAGITTGSERTVLRGPTNEPEGVARPELNIVFDQVTCHPGLKSLVYFTGGLTAAYRVADRRWVDLEPLHSPPPVVAGSLAYDLVNDEILLFGGGHVAETNPKGKLVGYTGTWVYNTKDRDWRQLLLDIQPSPRMNTRLVCDTRNQVLVLFGGDGQSHYLADTWIYDLKTRKWRQSKAPAGPEARAGHFTVYDPSSGWIIIGGGYNLRDLSDMWAYDVSEDRWRRLIGDVPTGFYITADIAPDQDLILLVTNTRKPGDTMTCNVLYPVRTTYGYRIDSKSVARTGPLPVTQQAIPKRPPSDRLGIVSNSQSKTQAKTLGSLPENRWVLLDQPSWSAPTRTWGSATFDTERGQILYWGGGHCGYGGNDVESYNADAYIWRSLDAAPEYPERTWDKGVRLAGVTFQGKPWTEHGRRIYAYDPVSHRMVMTRRIRLTTGYDPEGLRTFPSHQEIAPDALANSPSSYVKYDTWIFDPDTGEWELLSPAPAGVDTLVSTRHGVMGVNVNWPIQLNDAGYLLPWRRWQTKQDTAIYVLDVAQKRWSRQDEMGTAPQNLYEMTSLAYDSKDDFVILHGAGENHDELWIFDIRTRQWKNMQPGVAAPAGGSPPVASREAVYVPAEEVFLTYGPARERPVQPALWAYSVAENVWRRVEIPPITGIEPRGIVSENRAMVYDPKRDVIFLVLGIGGDDGKAIVYALRYHHSSSKFFRGAGH